MRREHRHSVPERLLGLRSDKLAGLEEQGVTGRTPPLPLEPAWPTEVTGGRAEWQNALQRPASQGGAGDSPGA
jgi:hypothetical protein